MVSVNGFTRFVENGFDHIRRTVRTENSLDVGSFYMSFFSI